MCREVVNVIPRRRVKVPLVESSSNSMRYVLFPTINQFERRLYSHSRLLYNTDVVALSFPPLGDILQISGTITICYKRGPRCGFSLIISRLTYVTGSCLKSTLSATVCSIAITVALDSYSRSVSSFAGGRFFDASQPRWNLKHLSKRELQWLTWRV